jgi:Tol biopolymer transport system component/DNA-binding winged helix-turn-helix (wHTH) protein
MATPVSTKPGWRFGVFEVDAHRGELRRSGVPLKLRDQSFQILVALLQNPGEIVTREELRRRLWPSDTFVDFDHSLNTAMMKLRDALGDSTEAPIYIETIPKRGYRFIAPVALTDALDPAANARNNPGSMSLRHGAELLSRGESIRSDRNHRPALTAGMLLVLGFAIAAGLAFYRKAGLTHAGKNSSPAVPQIVPITSAIGIAEDPVISPDGRAIAYVWDGPDRKHADVYTFLIGSELPLRLTYTVKGVVGHPAWSPDGREIAFTRCDGSNGEVYVVPAFTGRERRLTSVECQYDGPAPVAWSPEGATLFISDRCSPDAEFGLVSFSFATGEKRCLTQIGGFGYSKRHKLSISPDGKTLAFIPAPSSVVCEIYRISVSGDTPRLLLRDGEACVALMWTPDGKSIIFLSERTRLPSLWRIPANGGGRIEPETEYPTVGSFSRDGKRFVFAEQTTSNPPAVWRADLARAGGPVLGTKKLISTQYWERDAQPSADGRRIVWISERSARGELWVSNGDGTDALQLTHVRRHAGTPHWSPDGKWITFDCHMDDGPQVMIIDSEGRNLRQITHGATTNVVPSWSPDGRSIYFVSKRTGRFEVWVHALDTGAETQLTTNGGFNPVASIDHRFVYFTKMYEPGLWKMPLAGGQESQVIANKPPVPYWGHWAETESGIYVIDINTDSGPRIEFHEFASHKSRTVLAYEQQPLPAFPSLAATKDGKTIYYTQWDQQSVIKLMEFRP